MSFNEWEEVKLGEILEISSSKRIYAKEYVGSGIPFYRSKEVIEKSKGNCISTELFISKERFNEIRAKFGAPIDGDILLTSVGTLGIPYIVRNEKFYFKDGNLTWLKSFGDRCHNKFIYYWLISEYGKNQISAKCIGSTQKALTIDTLRKFDIKIPSLARQKSIAHILSTLDEKIEVNNQINKTLENMAQAIFTRWFVDFEFPNEDGEPYQSSGGEMVESELGMIPKGWVVGNLSDICKKIFSGGTPKTKEDSYWKGKFSWMSSGETRNSFLIATEKSITELGVKNSSTKLALSYCTVIASAGQGMTRGQTTLLLIDTFINQSIIALQAKNGFELYNFCSLSLRYDEMRGISDSHSIRGSLTTKMISKMPILIPDEDNLISFNEVVKKMFENIEKNILENSSLINIRDTLLPKLMSGEIIVPLDSEGEAS